MSKNRITSSEIGMFKAESEGGVHVPGDSGYEKARRVWNGLIDRRPGIISKCGSAEDVVRSLRFARKKGLLVAIRGGGHNVAGFGVCDHGMVIDMQGMNQVEVDPDSRTVRVGGGALWRDVDSATQAYGLATPGGEVSLTGVAGLTLGGGIGHLRRKHGLTCDNLVSATLVTAQGRIISANHKAHADLFWALKGGGGNFGVVLEFVFALHPLGPKVTALNPIFPVSESRKLLTGWYKFTRQAPDKASTAFAAWAIPALPGVPEELSGTPVCLLHGMYAGEPEKGEALFSPLRNISRPLMDMSRQTTYLDLQTAFDAHMKDGALYYWKSLFLDDLTDRAVDRLISWIEKRPDPGIIVIIRHMGGAVSRISENATAYVNRKAKFMLSIDGAWTDPGESARNIAWIRSFWSDMSRFSNGGVYVNFPGFGEGDQDKWRASYNRSYQRLARVKQQYDPENFFRMNQNILPADHL